jgi:DNA topoisomerase IB
MKQVATLLGNTPAVARSACVDPRVVERYEQGETIARRRVDRRSDPSLTRRL